MAAIGSIYPILFILESVLAFVIAYIIITKERDYYLNQIFALLVFCFGLYFLFESLIYFLTPDPFLANLFRDISLSGGILGAFLFFLASLFIWYGRDNVNTITIGSITALVIVLILAANLQDWVKTPIVNEVRFRMTDPTGTLLINIIPGIFILIGSVVYIRLYTISHEPEMRRKLLLFITSIISILFAILYYTWYIEALNFFNLYDSLSFIADWIGCLFYTIGLLSLLAAFWRDGENE